MDLTLFDFTRFRLRVLHGRGIGGAWNSTVSGRCARSCAHSLSRSAGQRAGAKGTPLLNNAVDWTGLDLTSFCQFHSESATWSASELRCDATSGAGLYAESTRLGAGAVRCPSSDLAVNWTFLDFTFLHFQFVSCWAGSSSESWATTSSGPSLFAWSTWARAFGEGSPLCEFPINWAIPEFTSSGLQERPSALSTTELLRCAHPGSSLCSGTAGGGTGTESSPTADLRINWALFDFAWL